MTGLTYEQTKNDFKICVMCEKVVYVQNDVCHICKSVVPKQIKCPRSECGYIMANYMCNFCPLCGSNILCLQCLGDVTQDAMYESDDDHAYCGN